MIPFRKKSPPAKDEHGTAATIELTGELRAYVDSRVEVELASRFALLEAKFIGLLPDWLRRAKEFPTTHEALGRRLADESREYLRYGSFGDDPVCKWYRRHGMTWLSQDAERHVGDALKNLRERLAQEADRDCFPAEADQRLQFINKQCRTMLDHSLILKAAGEAVGAPD